MDPSLAAVAVTNKRRLDLNRVAVQTGVHLARGLDASRDGYYFFLDCRYVDFEGRCPFSPYQVKGIQAHPHVATVRSGEISSMAVCNQDLARTGHEPVDKFAKMPLHLVPLDAFLSPFDLLALNEFTPQCIKHIKEMWAAT